MVPTKFMPVFPCFSALTDECTGPYLVVSEQGGKGLVVFTDEDLLLRFRQTGEASGPTIRFDAAGQLALYLDALPPDVISIAFDPNDQGKAVVVSAANLYRALLE